MKKITTWLLLANGTEARLVCSEGRAGDLRELDAHLPEGPNRPAREIMANKPGRTYDSFGKGRHGMEPRSDPRALESHRFLSQVADRINQAAGRDAFDRLVLIAPPKALGVLRQELGGKAREKLIDQRDKDLTKIPLQDLPAHLEPLPLS